MKYEILFDLLGWNRVILLLWFSSLSLSLFSIHFFGCYASLGELEEVDLVNAASISFFH